MTLVSPAVADIREGTSRRTDILHRRACAAFENCALASPPTLPVLASVFTEYLFAWRESSPEHHGREAGRAALQRLHEQVARLDGILRQAEQTVKESRPSPASLPNELAWLEEEAARFLAEIRDLLRSLDASWPAAQRLRLALLAAWGRYDDALKTVRQRAGGSSADPTIMASARDALVKHLESARSLGLVSGQADINGNRHHR